MMRVHRWLMVAAVVLSLAAVLSLLTAGGGDSLAANGIIYVDVGAPGTPHDGSTWDYAFTDLQQALDAAVAPVEIWVAAGTYHPTWQSDAGDARSATFQMANGVAIYGGFDPTVGDDTWEERDGEANPTILSGDIGVEGDPSDNAYHVFYHPDGTDLDGTAVIDGFTITGGNANGTSPHDHGGGMHNDGSSPALTNCTFLGNSAGTGGGMYNIALSGPLLANVTFSSNSANRNGAMFNGMFSSPALKNCTFEGNSADNRAGAIGNESGSVPKLTNCILWGDSQPEIDNQILSATMVTYSDIQGGCESISGNECDDGNIDQDPLFVDPVNGNLRLRPNSPCIDAGTNMASLPDHDFEGDPRIFDGDGDGVPIVDMGVDEARILRAYLPLVLRAF